MKNVILTATLFLGAAVMSVQAQTITATVPFDFEANGKSMPAGEYKMYKTSAVNGGLFVMRTADGSSSVLLPTKTKISDSEGPVKLVFNQRAGGYTLSELWDGSMGRTIETPRGRSSILAATKPATHVVIAAH